MASDLVLHGYFRSSATYRVRVALNYKGLRYQSQPVHLLKDGGEQLKADYRRLNPMAEVPTLVVDGKPVGQSMAILQLLEDLRPEPRLFGNDLFERARIVQLCENINAGIHPLQNLKVLNYLEKNHSFDQPMKEAWARHWIQQGLDALEQEAGKSLGPFIAGAHLTAADIYLIPQLFNARRFKVDLSGCPSLLAIEAACLKLECFVLAHPFRQVDTPEDLREK